MCIYRECGWKKHHHSIRASVQGNIGHLEHAGLSYRLCQRRHHPQERCRIQSKMLSLYIFLAIAMATIHAHPDPDMKHHRRRGRGYGGYDVNSYAYGQGGYGGDAVRAEDARQGDMAGRSGNEAALTYSVIANSAASAREGAEFGRVTNYAGNVGNAREGSYAVQFGSGVDSNLDGLSVNLAAYAGQGGGSAQIGNAAGYALNEGNSGIGRLSAVQSGDRVDSDCNDNQSGSAESANSASFAVRAENAAFNGGISASFGNGEQGYASSTNEGSAGGNGAISAARGENSEQGASTAGSRNEGLMNYGGFSINSASVGEFGNADIYANRGENFAYSDYTGNLGNGGQLSYAAPAINAASAGRERVSGQVENVATFGVRGENAGLRAYVSGNGGGMTITATAGTRGESQQSGGIARYAVNRDYSGRGSYIAQTGNRVASNYAGLGSVAASALGRGGESVQNGDSYPIKSVSHVVAQGRNGVASNYAGRGFAAGLVGESLQVDNAAMNSGRVENTGIEDYGRYMSGLVNGAQIRYAGASVGAGNEAGIYLGRGEHFGQVAGSAGSDNGAQISYVGMAANTPSAGKGGESRQVFNSGIYAGRGENAGIEAGLVNGEQIRYAGEAFNAAFAGGAGEIRASGNAAGYEVRDENSGRGDFAAQAGNRVASNYADYRYAGGSVGHASSLSGQTASYGHVGTVVQVLEASEGLGGRDDEYQAHPKYHFEYAVGDRHTGDVKNQWEDRDGDVIKGAYSLHEPDGTIRTVEYSSDKDSGFNAVVKKGGQAVHPHQNRN